MVHLVKKSERASLITYDDSTNRHCCKHTRHGEPRFDSFFYCLIINKTVRDEDPSAGDSNNAAYKCKILCRGT